MQKCKNAKKERAVALSFLFAALAQNVLNIDSQAKVENKLREKRNGKQWQFSMQQGGKYTKRMRK
ncbi:MAG: hypothetical protein II505_04670 [Bacteroidaceae bacterium]|nr:hypothetical protein [Bacteroidaceae bacterium]